MINNDDETFKRTISHRRVIPTASAEDEDEPSEKRFILSIIEKQSQYIFDEVARHAAANDLCLPLILTVEIAKDNKKSRNYFSAIN